MRHLIALLLGATVILSFIILFMVVNWFVPISKMNIGQIVLAISMIVGAYMIGEGMMLVWEARKK